jgi:hypothetical protein
MALDKDGGHYCRHVMAMTREDLHGKSDIAAELAWRDWRIAQLEASPGAATMEGPNMRAVCEALGFDPTNHHNAAKCPYCRPAPTTEPAKPITGLTEEEIYDLADSDECNPDAGGWGERFSLAAFAKAITRALAEKNGLAVQGGE